MTNAIISSSASAALSVVAAGILDLDVYGAEPKILAFPRRENIGGWDKLVELGAVKTGGGNFQFSEAYVPAGWEIRESGVSPWQKRLHDKDGNVLAKIFYKPAGGGGSIHVFLTADDPMASDCVTAGATKVITLPKRDNEGGWAKLAELGASKCGEDRYSFTDARVPAGWEIRDSGVSPWQKRLFDANGKLIALVFYKPSGNGSIHVVLSDNDPMVAH